MTKKYLFSGFRTLCVYIILCEKTVMLQRNKLGEDNNTRATWGVDPVMF